MINSFVESKRADIAGVQINLWSSNISKVTFIVKLFYDTQALPDTIDNPIDWEMFSFPIKLL